MADEIKEGDVVQLKSGGPWMTAGGIERGRENVNSIECFWFKDEELKWATFRASILKPVPSSEL